MMRIIVKLKTQEGERERYNWLDANTVLYDITIVKLISPTSGRVGPDAEVLKALPRAPLHGMATVGGKMCR